MSLARRGVKTEMTLWPNFCSHGEWVANDFVYSKGLYWGGRGDPREQSRQVSIRLDMKEEFHLEQGRHCHLPPLGGRK